MSNIVKVLFESKPQLSKQQEDALRELCQISLKSFLKANHNFNSGVSVAVEVVSNIVKVLFESKPQLVINVGQCYEVVSNIVKVLFESKPQLREQFNKLPSGCVKYR